MKLKIALVISLVLTGILLWSSAWAARLTEAGKPEAEPPAQTTPGPKPAPSAKPPAQPAIEIKPKPGPVPKIEAGPLPAAGSKTSPPSKADTRPSGTEPMVTIDFRDADIRVVAKFISELTGKNFIFDKDVVQQVTVYSPTKVTPEEAYRLFETVLKIHGFTTIPSDGLIKIVQGQKAKTMDIETRPSPPDEARARDDRIVTQLIRLKHADATEMRTMLQPLMDPRQGVLIAYDSGNTLIVTDYASNIDRLAQILRSVDVPDEGAKIAVIPLKFASAKEMAREIQEILKSSQAKPQAPGTVPRTFTVVPDDRTNHLIVLARQTELRDIKELVAALDHPSPRGSDRIHVYFLKNAVAEDLAKTLTELTGKAATPAAGGQPQAGRPPTPVVLQEEVFITADKATNSLIIKAERQDFLVLKNIIEKLDIQRSQVLVEGILMEMTLKKANALGAEWRILNPDKTAVVAGTNLGSGYLNQMTTNPFSGPAGMILGAAYGTLTWGGTTFLNLGALIHALEQDSDVNILSTPHLLTMDNEEAKIIVGEERPFLKSSMTTATGAVTPSVTNTYEFKNLGLTLKITPHITQGEFIKLKIFQQMQSFLSETVPGAVSSTKREAETTVQVKDGETVVIGGLIGDEYRQSRDQVPCLGHMPGLGWAFKSRDQSSNKLNLIILIRPTIIRGGDKLKEITDRKRQEVEPPQDKPGADEGFPRKGPKIIED